MTTKNHRAQASGAAIALAVLFIIFLAAFSILLLYSAGVISFAKTSQSNLTLVNGDSLYADDAPVFFDSDLDGVADSEDNCAYAYNPYQEDANYDGVGDACDLARKSPKKNGGSSGSGPDHGACSTDSQCPPSGVTPTRFCAGNLLYEHMGANLCRNAGHSNSFCQLFESNVLVEACAGICQDGACFDVACRSDDDCIDSDPLTLDICVNPGTAQSMCEHRPQGMCQPGATRSCGVSGLGACRFGSETCNAQGQWGSCTGAVMPVQESCDGIDNDCDGVTDEDSSMCGVGETCSQGHCTVPPTCTNQCTSGTRTCNGNGYQICYDFNNDGCSEWGMTAQCGFGQMCSSGACVPQQPSCTSECSNGARECNGNGYRTCRDFNNDGCFEWGATATCGFGQVCSSGNCVAQTPSCSNQCTNGARQCTGNGFQICRDYNNDGCTEWSAASNCGLGQTCNGGMCI